MTEYARTDSAVHEFTVVGSSGAPVAADQGTLVAYLVQDGTETGDAVLISSGRDNADNNRVGIYYLTCALSGRSIGDICWFRYGCAVNGVFQWDHSPPFRVSLNASIAPGNAIATEDAAGNVATGLSVPTAAANASQVRVELATELARLDAAVSSRATAAATAAELLATANGAATVAAQLGRLDATVSSRATTADVAVTVTPVHAVLNSPRHQDADLDPAVVGEAPVYALTLTDAEGAAVDLSGSTVRMVVATLTTAGYVTQFTLDNAAVGGITIGGTSNNVVTVTIPATHTTAAAHWRYWLWDATRDLVLRRGRLSVIPGNKT